MTETATPDFVLYVTDTPTYKVRLGGEKIAAKDGVLKLTLGQSAMLEQLMATRQDIKAAVKKIDLDKAAQVVKNHQAMRKNAAVRGPFASTNPGQQTVNDARQAQKSEILTGAQQPVHVETRKPLEVQEMPIPQAPKGTDGVRLRGLAAKFGKK